MPDQKRPWHISERHQRRRPIRPKVTSSDAEREERLEQLSPPPRDVCEQCGRRVVVRDGE